MKTTRRDVPEEEHTRFALGLDRELRVDGASHVWSPYSAGTVLGLLTAGAGGRTRRELTDLVAPVRGGLDGHLAALNSAVEAEDGLDLGTLNGLYVPADLPLRAEFEELVRGQANAEVDQVDFRGDAEGVRRKVNDRVSQVTRALIPELLSPGTVHPDVRMLLVNALWVKLAWRDPFEAAQTRDRPFHAPSGTHRVPTMHRTGRMTCSEHSGWRMVSLSGDHGLTLDVIVRQGSRAERSALPHLDHEALSGLYENRRDEQVSLALPRFAVSAKAELLEPMADSPARVRDLATDQADFSGISPEPLKVDAIVHQAVLTVDEKGAEGAAATAAVMVMSAAFPPKAKDFAVDRPFVFVLRRHEAVLFMGRVLDPEDPGPA
ncbi:serpin family protein [Nocardiopsis nanhaiensis]